MSTSPIQPEQTSIQQKDPLTPNVEDLYLESYAFTTAAAIVGSVDRKIFVVLRDGRNVFGILRTFDQFANLVLQDTIERIYLETEEAQESVPKRFAETYRGVFMIRGENVVMMGELDIDKEDDHLQEWQQIPFPEAEKELTASQAAKIKEQKLKSKNLLTKGLISDFAPSDLY
ncbi:sm-like protein LSm1 [[Candida] railenensis]|uniref:U6 snRNA-associated Sm-like protein LSm1 n=1 Tax=[Candida] railenensis TaxID=45579 RepID=A0A9P0VWQ6_9ASCO|nr:sm-like protein LSm1 [[Candida] railenensis]